MHLILISPRPSLPNVFHRTAHYNFTMIFAAWTLLAGLATTVVAATNVIHPNGRDDLCLHADKIASGGTVSL